MHAIRSRISTLVPCQAQVLEIVWPYMYTMCCVARRLVARDVYRGTTLVRNSSDEDVAISGGGNLNFKNGYLTVFRNTFFNLRTCT